MGPLTPQWEASGYEETHLYNDLDARVAYARPPSRNTYAPTQMGPLTPQWEASGYEETHLYNDRDARVAYAQPPSRMAGPLDYPQY